MTDEMINTVETVFSPRMKSARALDLYNIQTSENSATVVSIWPNQAAADRAMEAVSTIRSEATATFGSKIVSSQSGPVVVKAQPIYGAALVSWFTTPPMPSLILQINLVTKPKNQNITRTKLILFYF